MKNKHLACLLLLFCFASTAVGQRLSFHLNVGSAVPNKPASFTEQYGSSLSLGAGVGVRTQPFEFLLGVRYETFANDLAADENIQYWREVILKSWHTPDEGWLQGGDHTILAGTINAKYRPPLELPVVPYLVGGFGLYYSTFESIDLIFEEEPPRTYREEDAHALQGANLGFGFEYSIGSLFDVYLEPSYVLVFEVREYDWMHYYAFRAGTAVKL